MTGEKTVATVLIRDRAGDEVRVTVPGIRTKSPHLVVTPYLLGLDSFGKLTLDPRRYDITHVPSGYALGRTGASPDHLVLLADRIIPMGDWSVGDPRFDWPREQAEAVVRVLDEFRVEHGWA